MKNSNNKYKFTAVMIHPVNALFTNRTMMTSLCFNNLTMFTNILELRIIFDIFNLMIIFLMKMFSIAWICHNRHTKIIYNVEENPKRYYQNTSIYLWILLIKVNCHVNIINLTIHHYQS